MLFTCLNIPYLFLFQLKETNLDSVFTIVLVQHKPEILRNFFNIYTLFHSFIVQILPIILLMILNTIMINKYRKLTELLKNNRCNRSEYVLVSDKRERRFARSMIITSSLFIFCKILDLINILLIVFDPFLDEKSLPRICREIAFLSIFIFHVLNNFIYIYNDSNLRKMIFSKNKL